MMYVYILYYFQPDPLAFCGRQGCARLAPDDCAPALRSQDETLCANARPSWYFSANVLPFQARFDA